MEDLEKGEDGGKKCRICHLSLVGAGVGDGHDGAKNQEENRGTAMELGCKCKNDLAFVHQHCAEAWFKIKGNNVCEICGSTATNMVVVSEAVEVVANASVATEGTPAPGPDTDPDPDPAPPADARPFWAGHRVLNFLLALVTNRALSLMPSTTTSLKAWVFPPGSHVFESLLAARLNSSSCSNESKRPMESLVCFL